MTRDMLYAFLDEALEQAKKFYTDHPIVNWGIFIDRFDMLGRKAIEKERKAGEKKKTDGT